MNRTDSLYYDPAGRILRSVSSDRRVVGYSYDQNGNLTSITPLGKPDHTFEYNANDAQTLYTPPPLEFDSLTSTQYAYNANNQLTRTTFADGSFIDISYDSIDGMPRYVNFDGGQINFTYDSMSGVLKSIASPEGNTLSYTYDGSLPLTESWAGEVNGTVGAKYNTDFKVTAQTINGMDTVKFVYDKDGNLIGVGQLKLKLNPQNGMLQYDTLGNTTTAYSYSTLGELTGYTAKYGSTTLYQIGFTRDSLGRISTKTETIGGETKQYRYRYDTAGRLWEVYRNDTLTSRYEYDQNGNRVYALRNSIPDSGRYDSQDRMTNYGGNDYVYTKSGYLQFKIHGIDTTSFAYDNYGNLISVKLPDGTWVQYVVDATNRRIGKQINGSWIQKLVYSGDLAPAAELDSANNIVARFIYSTHQNVPDYIVKGGTTYKVITDQLGSVRLVVDNSTGGTVQRIDYDEFGRVIFDSNPGFQPFGFAGGLFDQQTKLVRFGARDYDAFVGKWTAKDPSLFAGGDANIFTYCKDDPINHLDVGGLFADFYTLQFSNGLVAAQKIDATERFVTTIINVGKVLVGAGMIQMLTELVGDEAATDEISQDENRDSDPWVVRGGNLQDVNTLIKGTSGYPYGFSVQTGPGVSPPILASYLPNKSYCYAKQSELSGYISGYVPLGGSPYHHQAVVRSNPLDYYSAFMINAIFLIRGVQLK